MTEIKPRELNELPKDVLIEIFIKIEPKALVGTCFAICKLWYHILNEDAFWIMLATKEKCRQLLPPKQLLPVIRNDFSLARMYAKRPFNRNLIANELFTCNGWKRGFFHEHIFDPNQCYFINPPAGVASLYWPITNCIHINDFSLSQFFYFKDIGIDHNVIKKYKPTITMIV
uniref:F-box domain-containing protein n=1 Tax=Rhabditophanes sp. KR3021 TaxID=114890 RepID=A0AC35TUE1_9BILA